MPDTMQSVAMTSPPDDVDTVHDLLEVVWSERSDISLRDRISFETAVIELASNVMRHADSGGGVSCRLDVTVKDRAIEATLTDSGKPGNIRLSGRNLPDELAESGRGIPLITALVDVVEYDRREDLNHWYISRTLTS